MISRGNHHKGCNCFRCFSGTPVIICPPLSPVCPPICPTGPTGPTGPAATGCCPCTNLPDNPGFDESPTGAPGWTGTFTIVSGDADAHSGRFFTSPTVPVIQAASIPGLASGNIPVGQVRMPGYITQTVPVSPGCCYTLSFMAHVTNNARLVGSVSFPPSQTCPPLITNTGTGTATPITNNPFVGADIPHIVSVDNHQPRTFQNYTLVVCTPPGAMMACITFQNIGAVGATVTIDNVVFQPTGGSCDPEDCEQNF